MQKSRWCPTPICGVRQCHREPLRSLSAGREKRQPQAEMQRGKTVHWLETVADPFLVFYAIYVLSAVRAVQCM